VFSYSLRRGLSPPGRAEIPLSMKTYPNCIHRGPDAQPLRHQKKRIRARKAIPARRWLEFESGKPHTLLLGCSKNSQRRERWSAVGESYPAKNENSAALQEKVFTAKVASP